MSNLPALLPEPPAGVRHYVETPDALVQAAAAIIAAPALALDVEAGKPRTATMTVATLIQIAAPGQTWLIDVLRLNGKLGPLDEALRASVPVVLFDAPGDVRWLEAAGVHLGSAIDALQVTRSAYGEQDKSLREALRRQFRVGLDKAGQQADWMARPISPPLRHYAARDAELTLALGARYRDLFPSLVAVHTYLEGRAPLPEGLPNWLHRALSGDRAPTYVLAEEDGLPMDQDESIPALLEGAGSGLDLVVIPWQRARVYRAIAGLDLNELVERVALGLSSLCAVERTAAAKALGDLHATAAAGLLEQATRDPIADVSRAATRALHTLSAS